MVQVLPEVPSFGTQFARNLGGGVSRGLDFASQMALQKQKYMLPKEDLQRTKEALISHGISPEDADLYARLTTGGQTQFAKDILEQRKRGEKAVNKIQEREVEPEAELEEVLSTQDEGLTPAEKISRGKERYTSGLKIYQEAGTKLRGMTRDKQNLDILNKLNASGKLPKNFGRLNVDKEGNLKFAFLGTPEAQRYQKTLNEFSTGAKDTFGARVTNFDLAQYLKRYPTLLNTEEGRRQLLQQMKIVNDINSVYYKNLKDIYDKAGGVRKVDADVAESLAERKSEKRINDLVQKFDAIGEPTSMPSASENKGRKIRNPETGEVLISDGENWIPEE